MTGLISGGIQRLFGLTARDAARAKMERTAAWDAGSVGALAAERKEASLIRKNGLLVGERPNFDLSAFKAQARDHDIVDRSGAPVGADDVEAVFQEAYVASMAPQVAKARKEARHAGLVDESSEFHDAVATGVLQQMPAATQAGQKAVEELARNSFIISDPKPGALRTTAKPLFTVGTDGKFQPVPFETRLDWVGEVKIADDAAHSARIARGQSDADKLRAWKYAPTPVKVGVPLAAAGGLGWGAVELSNGDD